MDKRTAILLMLLLPALARADIYRWVDHVGQVHYSEMPPQGLKSEKFTPPPTQPGTSPNVNQLHSFLAESEKAQQESAKAQSEARTVKSAKAQRCAQAREQLTKLGEHPASRVMVPDGNGGYKRMTEDDYAAEMQNTQKAISESCG